MDDARREDVFDFGAPPQPGASMAVAVADMDKTAAFYHDWVARVSNIDAMMKAVNARHAPTLTSSQR